MGRKPKEYLEIMNFIVKELTYHRNGLTLKSLYDTKDKNKSKFKKNYIIDSYKILAKDDVIEVLQNMPERTKGSYFLKLKENIITKKIDQINYWIKLFTEQQKPVLKKLRKTVIIKDYKNQDDGKGFTVKFNPNILHDLGQITDQTKNVYRHFSALSLAFDLDLIPKVYEELIRETQKSGIKFIKKSLDRITVCEKNHPKTLKRYLTSMFASELTELRYYEQYYESKKDK